MSENFNPPDGATHCLRHSDDMSALKSTLENTRDFPHLQSSVVLEGLAFAASRELSKKHRCT